MTIDKAVVIENWIRTNIIGSFLYIAILAFSEGYSRFSIIAYFTLFMIFLFLSHLILIPQLLIIRLLIAQFNTQRLSELQYLLRVIISMVLCGVITLLAIEILLPGYHATFYVSVGFSYLMPGIYLWYRSIFKPKKIIKIENDEIIDNEELL